MDRLAHVPQVRNVGPKVRGARAAAVQRARDSGPIFLRALQWLRRFVAWWGPLLWLIASILAAGLAFATWFGVDPLGLADDCQTEQLACGISLDLAAASLIASIGYFLLFFRGRNRILKRYLERAAETPSRLLETTGASTGEPVLTSRQDDRDDIINEVNSARKPQPILIVGDGGVGKRALLAAVIGELATTSRRGRVGPPSRRVPVPVVLRPDDEIDFETLARNSFLAQTGNVLDSPQRAESIWAKVRRSLGVVVLVDGLGRVDHFSKQARDARVKEALEVAARERIAVVMSVRPGAVPNMKNASAYVLERFDDDQLRKYLRERLRRNEEARSPDRSLTPAKQRERDAELVEWAEALARRVIGLHAASGLDALRTPFYLDLVAAIDPTKVPESMSAGGRWALQRELLDRYVEFLGESGTEAGMTASAVDRMLQAVEEFAPQMLIDGGEFDERRLEDPEAMIGGSALPLAERKEAIWAALEIGLLKRLTPSEPLRFGGPALHAYLAARRFEDCPDVDVANGSGGVGPRRLWEVVLDETSSEELMSALTMYAVEASDEEAREICDALLERAEEGLDPDKDLRLVRTAAEIANARSFEQRYERIARVGRREGATDRLDKLRFFRAVANLGDTEAYRTLFEYARAAGPVPIKWGDFVLRWAATKHLVKARHSAYQAIRDEVIATIEEADASANERSERDCAIVGWILPGLRELDGSDTDAEIQHWTERMAALAVDRGRFDETGIENALARGFKIDALSREMPRLDPLVPDLLANAAFWHSRISLVHAAAIPCFGEGTSDDRAIRCLERLAGKNGEKDPHPMVAEAARLSLEGIANDKPRSSYIWEAEGHATSQARSALTKESAQLVGDVAILMSLIYSRKADKPTERIREQVIRDIPPCLCGKHRADLFNACTCDFKLCPVREQTVSDVVRGEMSQAFCRRQRDIAHSRQNPPWQPAIRRKHLVAFWKTMEEERSARKPLLEQWESVAADDRSSRSRA